LPGLTKLNSVIIYGSLSIFTRNPFFKSLAVYIKSFSPHPLIIDETVKRQETPVLSFRT
jgi:hypothetical protein